MHVGDGKSSSAASRSSSLVNLFKRRGSTGETLRYICVRVYCPPSTRGFLPRLMPRSNGKSVSWAQTERSSSRGNHLWQRLSFHIKKKENNQTAVIKPFSKTSEERYCGGSELPPHAPLPSLSSMSSLPTHLDSGTDKTLYELSEAEEHYSITYLPQTPSPISTISQRIGASLGEESQVACISKYSSSVCSGGSSSSCGPPSSGSVAAGSDGRLVAVDDRPPQPQNLMDQISCVVNRFTANITELNSMMLSTSPTHTHKHTSPTAHPPDPYLLPREIPMPPTLTTYADVQPLPPIESSLGSRGGCPVHSIPRSPYPLPPPHPHTSPSLSPIRGSLVACPPDSPLRRAELEEELIALTPPSPFRDSMGSSSGSQISETGLIVPPVPNHPPPSPPSPRYTRLTLRNYSQSSSSL
ncbi:hypothetical protein XENOCAPTIV_011146 [Xenoophorus captivus]|uniref:Metabotropic glutamate receptor Homer-binding domain-containing protein n=1 Tax=Xenoophorus captivus TaxID=1517983 RepID=A0ABV0QWL6_9TELE